MEYIHIRVMDPVVPLLKLNTKPPKDEEGLSHRKIIPLLQVDEEKALWKQHYIKHLNKIHARGDLLFCPITIQSKLLNLNVVVPTSLKEGRF